jgi:hypothetical protein
MYKTLTGIIAKRISTHFEEQSLLPAEQKGCHPGSKGCKDQLMISKAIYEDCSRRNKNLSIAWIDYQKAFDSVPHSWVEKSIELLGVNSKILTFCKLSIEPVCSRSSPAAGERPEESPSPTWDFLILVVAVAMQIKLIMLFLPSTPLPYMVTVW